MKKIQLLHSNIEILRKYGFEKVDYYFMNFDNIFEFQIYSTTSIYIGFIFINLIVISVKTQNDCRIIMFDRDTNEILRLKTTDKDSLIELKNNIYKSIKNGEKINMALATNIEFIDFKTNKIIKKIK